VGKKAIVAFVPVEATKRLKQIAIEEDSSIQRIMTEGLNMWLAEHGRPPLV
jgi:hypothetical protein